MPATNTRVVFHNGNQVFIENKNFESICPMAPFDFYDDFIGAGHSAIPAAGSPAAGYAWVKKIVGAAPPTVAPVANAGAGQFACTLTSASQKQDAVLYWNDALSLDATKGLYLETRAQLTVLPSAAGVQAVWGMAAAWIDGPDNNVAYLQFGCTANGNLLIRSYDGTTQNSIAASFNGAAIVVDTTLFHTYRINARDVTDVAFFYDGNRVNAANSIGFAATGASAIMQPYSAVYKPSGTGVATLTIDAVRAWANR
jgi:hypothetical protein